MKIKNIILLFITAAVWGNAFVAQSVGMDLVGPFTFNGIRTLIGGIVLLPVIFVLNRGKKKDVLKKSDVKMLLKGGIFCGFILATASSFQQFGIMETSVGKTGFLTALYIIFVPILSIFLKKRCSIFVWIGVLVALMGVYFLCMTESLSLGHGEILVLIGSVLFAVHILVIDYFAARVDGVKMACIQFFVAGFVCCILMVVFEKPSIMQIITAWKPILYAGAMSCGIGYTLQIVGQKGMNPTVAALILSLESVVAVISGFLILGQKLSYREVFGCVLMFGAIVLAQIPAPKKEKERLWKRA
ncbi:MAG: DMT family transporter [Anaerostipes sp.]|jgi:drug/metabolite transporter (DMT)-like permease|nr:DMT family transporter [Anaerostipes sp.]MDD3746953.1 DMT family transporter [Anaerostipes sp.]